MTQKDFEKNLAIIEIYDCEVSGENGKGIELCSYTSGGEQMLITLDELSSNALNKWLDGFDANEQVIFWWPNGRKDPSVPFDNVADHYNDYMDWVEFMRDIANDMC